MVITHPYTYLALFTGLFLPALGWATQKEKSLNPYLTLVLLGVALPLVLGIFIHVRPMAGFLLGMVTSSFLFGILFAETFFLGLLSYLSMAAVVWGLPLFKSLSNISRWVRLEILAGIFLVAIIIVLLKKKSASADA